MRRLLATNALMVKFRGPQRQPLTCCVWISLFALAGCKHEASPAVRSASGGGGDAGRQHRCGACGTRQSLPRSWRRWLRRFAASCRSPARSPDVSREIPVLSLANGRVIALHVGLGDTVRKGQLLMEVQSPDVYGLRHLPQGRQRRAPGPGQLDRDKLLYDKGAIPKSQLEDRAERRGRRPGRAHGQPRSSSASSAWTRTTPPTPSRSTRPPPASSSRRTSPPPEPPGSPTRARRLAHHRRPVARLGHLRRLRERPRHGPPRPAGRHPPHRLSRQGLHGHHLATSAPSSTPPSAPPRFASRSTTPAASCASACSPPRRCSAATRRSPRPPSPPAPSSTCTTATSSSIPRRRRRRLPPRGGQDRRHAPDGNMQEVARRPRSPASRSSPTPSPAEHGGPVEASNRSA